MPHRLSDLRRLNDIVAGRGAGLAGRMFSNSEQVGGPGERKRALAAVLPNTIAPVSLAMSEGTRQWYAAQPSSSGYEPTLLDTTARALVPERVEVMVGWALTQAAPRAAFESGIDRYLRNVSRDTVLANVDAEPGARWYRHASANACGFCRMLATRGAVYRSAKAAGEGNRFHDRCHCLAVVVRPGQSYDPPAYVAEWEQDYQAARAAGLTQPGQIATFMNNAPTGKATVARAAQEKRLRERRQGFPGGPGGSPPPKPPTRGGRGYSDDDSERQLEWEYDEAAQRLTKDPDTTLAEVQQKARALQSYRAANGVTGRLDERIGKPFDNAERLVVDKLLAEGRNVSSISESAKVQGRALPDMFVDAELAEIKTSTSGNVRAFGGRVAKVQAEQSASRTYVNAARSKIPHADLEAEMRRIVASGDAGYIRIIGEDSYDVEIGKW
ncbi:MAG: hypothetical protein QM662_04915 [Gordonia sp. (in: high G+C Gram-positive bacteria)]